VVRRAERQAADRDTARAPPRARCAALAVASGAGMRALYESLGVFVVDGGPTLSPSTFELLAGIHAARAEQVVVLPNGADVVLVAERAAELSDKVAAVVPTTSQQAGLAVALALDPERDARANAAAMDAALRALRTGGVAHAAREDPAGRWAVGDAVGYVGDELVAWGDPERTLGAVLAGLADGAGPITCIAGDGAPLADERVRALAPAGVELELSRGGQPSWWWLLAAG
ncbi:MAG TPA: hypothetical protein VHB30_00900, partial [Solirubrobacteraceae bacterium]|nr:hypothetical protein [Solirubrobacteraceae bacterium]